MVEDGYDVYGVIDASGAESPMAWEAAVAGLGGCGGHSRHARGEGEDLVFGGRGVDRRLAPRRGGGLAIGGGCGARAPSRLGAPPRYLDGLHQRADGATSGVCGGDRNNDLLGPLLLSIQNRPLSFQEPTMSEAQFPRTHPSGNS